MFKLEAGVQVKKEKKFLHHGMYSLMLHHRQNNFPHKLKLKIIIVEWKKNLEWINDKNIVIFFFLTSCASGILVIVRPDCFREWAGSHPRSRGTCNFSQYEPPVGWILYIYFNKCSCLWWNGIGMKLLFFNLLKQWQKLSRSVPICMSK